MSDSSSRVVIRQPYVQTTRGVATSNKAVKCSFCISPILTGHRFLCANCPIVTETSLDGFNLCPACEEHSLQCHDSTHFFIKINAPAREMDTRGRIPLGERWNVHEIVKSGALLPTLYAEVEQSDPLQPPAQTFRSRNGASGANLSVRVGDGMVISSDYNSNGLSRAFARGGSEARQRAQEIEMSALRASQSRYIVPIEKLVHP